MPSTAGTNAARNTSIRIVNAQRTGAPLMIPGSLEPRGDTRCPNTVAGSQAFVPELAGSAAKAGEDRVRAQYQIEGGGARSQRRPPGRRTFGARLWHACVGRGAAHEPRIPNVPTAAAPQTSADAQDLARMNTDKG